MHRSMVEFDPAVLVAARRRWGLSRAQLAEVSRVSPAAIASWERGDTRPTVVSLAKVAACVSLEVPDLLAVGEVVTLRGLRLARGFTIREAAAAAGLSTATVSRVENGLGQLTGDVAGRLAVVYGVEPTVVTAAART